MQDPKIYSDTYQMALTIFERTKNFPKALRPTLGRKIEEASMELIVAIRVATTTPGGLKDSIRIQNLREASRCLDQIRIFVQIAHDLGSLPVSAFSEISNMTLIIGKQIGAMIRFETRKDESPSKSLSD